MREITVTPTQTKLRTFQSIDWYHLKDRGDVAFVRNDEDFENGKRHLVDEEVLIDGKVYCVRGVETNCIPRISKGTVIGLLVEGRSPHRHKSWGEDADQPIS